MAPEITAYVTPSGERVDCAAAITAAGTATRLARVKAAAVRCVASPGPLPAREYSPQPTPAITMSPAPTGSGALTPGDTRYTTPADAPHSPTHSNAAGRTPRRMPNPIMVICTLPNSRRA